MDNEKRIAELVKELEGLGVTAERSVERVDKTKGIVKQEQIVKEDTSPTIIEKAEFGKGFALYSDYSKIDKSNTKLKRLIR